MKREMTPKSFLSKTKTKAATSALAFITAHREFLQSGELGILTAPIFEKMDGKTLEPVPALDEIKEVIFAHIQQVNVKNAEASLVKKEKVKEVSGNHIATIYDSRGIIQQRRKEDGKLEDLVKGFEMSQDACRWADRFLFECGSDCFAVIQHTAVGDQEIIERADSIARILRRPKSPFLKAQKKTTSKLSFGGKAQQDHSHFSHG